MACASSCEASTVGGSKSANLASSLFSLIRDGFLRDS